VNDHEKRITSVIIEAIEYCRQGEILFLEMEGIILSQLDALDSTYPKSLRNRLRNLPSTAFEGWLAFFDVPYENWGIDDVTKATIDTVLKKMVDDLNLEMSL
jgi:hypothetical protein